MVAPVQPQLYLFSSADALIPPSEVQLFMQQQVRPPSLAAFHPIRRLRSRQSARSL